jgi:hypothetical protein
VGVLLSDLYRMNLVFVPLIESVAPSLALHAWAMGVAFFFVEDHTCRRAGLRSHFCFFKADLYGLGDFIVIGKPRSTWRCMHGVVVVLQVVDFLVQVGVSGPSL